MDGLLVIIVVMCVVMYVCSFEYSVIRDERGEFEADGECWKCMCYYIFMVFIFVVFGIIMVMMKDGVLSGLKFGLVTLKILSASWFEVKRGIVNVGVL